ncbi:MAG: hypothetical protein HY318_17780 [Armatimonadetes bacterium]|nr:hypothetical protein [Armatimonadota bacterium]
MMFTESNTIEQMILDTAVNLGGRQRFVVRERSASYGGKAEVASSRLS